MSLEERNNYRSFSLLEMLKGSGVLTGDAGPLELGHFIQRRIVEVLKRPAQRYIGLPPPPGATQARLDVHTGDVEMTLEAPLKRVMIALQVPSSGLPDPVPTTGEMSEVDTFAGVQGSEGTPWSDP